MHGIYFDLSNNNLYIASYWFQKIYIYHTNDEITFNKNGSISASYHLLSITIKNDNIYTGTINGTILVYNKVNGSLRQVMTNMCSSNIWSVRHDCNGNMIYSCYNPPMLKIIGINGINSTLLLNDSFPLATETFIDSKNRLWIGGRNGSIVYT
jgi:hypothetical protein